MQVVVEQVEWLFQPQLQLLPGQYQLLLVVGVVALLVTVQVVLVETQVFQPPQLWVVAVAALGPARLGNQADRLAVVHRLTVARQAQQPSLVVLL
jgi:hypothetical protein